MTVNARVLHWTATGMRESGGIGDYIEVRDAERLLEEAHARGREQGRWETEEALREAAGRRK